jgi:hypothetical protein
VHTVGFSRAFRHQTWWGVRYDRHAAISKWVNGNIRPGSTFMAHEFGTLGYLTGLRMIDTFGLINETNDYPKRNSHADHLALVRLYEPDLVLCDLGRQGQLLERATGYSIIRFFEWEAYASTLLVRSPDVLSRPERFEEHRRAIPSDIAMRTGNFDFTLP